MVGQTLAEQGVTGEIVPPYFSVKEAVFPFIKFPGVDTILGPEMRSTGEVMGVGRDLRRGLLKSQLAAGVKLPSRGKVFISVKNPDKPRVRRNCARRCTSSGFRWSPRAARPPRLPPQGFGRDAGEQGHRRAAAHRRHDQQRRDRADRQHRRREAQCDPGQLRSAAPRSRAGTDYTTLAGAGPPRRHEAPRELVPYSTQALHQRLQSPPAAQRVPPRPPHDEESDDHGRGGTAQGRAVAAEDRRPSGDLRAIAEARSHGDLSENAEYDAAKERQGFIEARIREIESKLAHAQIIDPAELDADGRVVFGATVDLEDLDLRRRSLLPDRRRRRSRHQGRQDLGQLADRARADRQACRRYRGVQAPSGARAYEVLAVRYL